MTLIVKKTPKADNKPLKVIQRISRDNHHEWSFNSHHNGSWLRKK